MDLQTLAATPPRQAVKECGIAYALRVLPVDEAEQLVAALANPYASHTDIAQALDETLQATPAFTIGRHRRGQCRCGR